jgi:hypothetical protein
VLPSLSAAAQIDICTPHTYAIVNTAVSQFEHSRPRLLLHDDVADGDNDTGGRPRRVSKRKQRSPSLHVESSDDDEKEYGHKHCTERFPKRMKPSISPEYEPSDDDDGDDPSSDDSSTSNNVATNISQSHLIGLT